MDTEQLTRELRFLEIVSATIPVYTHYYLEQNIDGHRQFALQKIEELRGVLTRLEGQLQNLPR